MLRTLKARKLLTKKEQKHLTEMNINTLAGMKRQIEFMKKRAEEDNYPMTVQCYDCFKIGQKLGLLEVK